MNAAEIAVALGGQASQNGLNKRCPCTECGKTTLELKDNPNGRVHLLIKCWNGCQPKAIRSALKARGWLNGSAAPPETDEQRAAREAEEAFRRQTKINSALDTWRQAIPATGTMAETYLCSRLLLHRPVPTSLRFATAIHHPQEQRTFPALVGLVEHQTGGPIGIHTILLNPLDPSSKLTIKARKLSFGTVKGGAVRLFPAEPELAIGEGIEDCLAFQQATGIPTWATIGQGGLVDFAPPPVDVVSTLILLEDQDNGGRKAVDQAGKRFTQLGYKVRVARPLVSKDINAALLSIGLTEPICAIADFEPGPPQLSDDDLALRFSDQHAPDLRYVAMWGKWLEWRETNWQREETLRAFDLARALCRNIAGQLKDADQAGAIASARTVAAVERMARSDRRHAAITDQWNADDWVFNQPQESK